MQAPLLEGVTVVEVGNGALTGMVGMVLADFGARVVWFEYGAAAESYHIWHRGKERISVTLGPGDPQAESTAEVLRGLIIDSADVFLTDLCVARLHELGLSWEILGAQREDLIYAEVSGFGEHSCYAHLAADGAQGPVDESVVAAAIGRMMVFEGVAPRPGPVYPALQVGTHGASQATLAGILAQLINRLGGGRGQRQQATMLRALTAYDLIGLGASQAEPGLVPESDPHTLMPMLNFQPVQCADGRWLQLGNLLPHLMVNFLQAVGLQDILDDPEFATAPHAEATAERFRKRICEHMRSRSLTDWMALFEADGGVAAAPYQTTQEALHDPDNLANGHSNASQGFLQLGLLGQFSKTPGKVGGAASVKTLADAT